MHFYSKNLVGEIFSTLKLTHIFYADNVNFVAHGNYLVHHCDLFHEDNRFYYIKLIVALKPLGKHPIHH